MNINMYRSEKITSDEYDSSYSSEAVEYTSNFDESDGTIATTSIGQYVYSFSNHFHPFVVTLSSAFSVGRWRGVWRPTDEAALQGLVDVEGLDRQTLTNDEAEATRFESAFGPDSSVYDAYPSEIFDFSPNGSYSIYNWELFLHAPMHAARRLTAESRYADALEVWHSLFNPVERRPDPAATEAGPWDLWHFRLFKYTAPDPEAPVPLQSEDEWAAWTASPFDPHAVARLRPTAYQVAIVMGYVGTLVAWGDSLFREDSQESLAQAAMLYVRALEIIGRKPVKISRRGTHGGGSFRTRRAAESAAVAAEAVIGGWGSAALTGAAVLPGELDGFPIPVNPSLLAIWDKIEDRLFKLRNSLSIDGVFRALPLYQPPIDPALLVRAAALGLSVSEIAGLAGTQAVPATRYRAAVALALQMAGEVKSLGQALTSALERKDAEVLAQMRSTHEIDLLDLVKQVRVQQVREAEYQVEAQERSIATTRARSEYYGKLIDESLLDDEKAQKRLMVASGHLLTASAASNTAAAVLSSLGHLDSTPKWIWGPSFIGNSLSQIGGALSAQASVYSTHASVFGVNASNTRRLQEWTQQRNQAHLEAETLTSQLSAAKIRLDIAKRELTNHELQVEQRRLEGEFLTSKFSTADLYDWMASELRDLYRTAFDLAFDVSRLAERAWRHEIGDMSAGFLGTGYFDLAREGLLAGERLTRDLHAMEAAYLERNVRRHELVKDVSLAEWDPDALVQLRNAGTAAFTTSPVMFDLDVPGHYERRLLSVAVTVSCVRGANTAVPLKVTLATSGWHKGPVFYEQNNSEEFRYGNPQSIVTSHGQRDTGVISNSDARYAPFEGEGATGSWLLELPRDVRPFDYSTIQDVVLHLSYSAKDGGSTFRDQVASTVRERLREQRFGPERDYGRVAAFSLRSVAPDAWHAWVTGESATLAWSVADADLPAGAQALGDAAWSVAAVLEGNFDAMASRPEFTLTAPGDNEVVTEGAAAPVSFSRRVRRLASESPLDPTVPVLGEWVLEVTENAEALAHLDDVVVVVALGSGPWDSEGVG
jgi:hypothetical protein